MAYEKFDVAKLERLNDVARFDDLPPEVMWAVLGNPDARSIVDVGAGTGLFACRFAEMAPDAEVYAIDIEPRMVRWMMEHKPASACGRLHPLLGRETAVPLRTGEADLVTMINLHHELADPEGSYREALRLLRVGGQLLVVDWTPGDSTTGPPQNIRASAEQIAAILDTAGFGCIEVHPGLPKHSLVTASKPVPTLERP